MMVWWESHCLHFIAELTGMLDLALLLLWQSTRTHCLMTSSSSCHLHSAERIGSTNIIFTRWRMFTKSDLCDSFVNINLPEIQIVFIWNHITDEQFFNDAILHLNHRSCILLPASWSDTIWLDSVIWLDSAIWLDRYLLWFLHQVIKMNCNDYICR